MKRIIAAAIGMAIVGAVAAVDIEREEKIELKFAQDGRAPEVIVLDDFENFPIGATETIRTESGTEALVTRVEDGLVLELNGEQIEVSLPGAGLHEHGGFDIELADMDGDVEIIEKRVFISDTLGEDGDVHEWVEAHGDGTHERHVIIRSEAHAEHDVDVDVEHDTEVVVIKRKVTREDTND